MGVIITDEMIQPAAPGTDGLEAIARLGRRVRAWIDLMLAVPGFNRQSAIDNRQSSIAVFIDKPFIEGRQFERELSRTWIVCGNCAGDDDRPRRTMLIRDPLTQTGCCAGCGGRSYELAARCYPRKPVSGSGFGVQG
jgi:hypothetical protein